MKKKIFKSIAASIFVLGMLFNLSYSLNNNFRDHFNLNLVLNQASATCMEYAWGGWVCCYETTGGCYGSNYGGPDQWMDGPYYFDEYGNPI